MHSFSKNLKITTSQEKLLARLFYHWERGIGRVHNSELANGLKLKPSTISNMVKELSEYSINGNPLIQYQKYHGVRLTNFGNKFAGIIVRRKRLKELFLKELGFNFQDMHKYSKRMEICEEIADKFEDKIINGEHNRPLRCPHGALIPNENGKVKYEFFRELTFFSNNTELEINRFEEDTIKFENSPFSILNIYDIIEDYDLYPGNIIEIKTKTDNEIILKKNNKTITLPKAASKIIFCNDFYS